MAFFEDIISGLLLESIVAILKAIGASLRWVFFRGRYSFKTILDQDWNITLGLTFIAVILCVYFYFR